MGRWLYALCALPWILVGSVNETNAAADMGAFEGYADTPAFEVVPRKHRLQYYPCSQCHQFMEPNPKPRELVAPHRKALNHGKGRIWCLTCHHKDERDHLTTPLDERVDFDQSHLVCGGCHANRHKDWYFGGHGKRLANWQGERTLYNCVHCHNAHDPEIQPRKAMAPPPVRTGLDRPKGNRHPSRKVWDQPSDEH